MAVMRIVAVVVWTTFMVAATAFCARRAFVNGREGRRGWNKPILADPRHPEVVEVAADRLNGIKAEWPMRNENRWPPPTPERDRTLMRAYAAIAGRLTRAQTITAEILLVVGSAWLSVNLRYMWSDYEQARSATAKSGSNTSVWLDQLKDFGPVERWANLLPVAVIAVGLALRLNALGYGRIEAVYARAASRPADAVPVGPEARLLGPDLSFVERLRQRIRKLIL